MQKLVTKELERKTPKLYETDGQGKQATAQARYFSLVGGLAGWEWYMTEYDPESKQAFGLVKGYCSELGYFSLEEFEQMNRRAGFQVIERDITFEPCELSKVA